jgi:hypothetical protein
MLSVSKKLEQKNKKKNEKKNEKKNKITKWKVTKDVNKIK